ncbi:MAG: bifunctional 4-hydroxy-3-methylbut-2-enyl diphosphate reductase/30S ribosomal protein S1 [Oscillospiraceae bacterium]|jgi:4-hydroxy-3-methylbut-2-enyl diphosphate reductase|nr:bifunctional 4-hydroxy-3-methylbut-2-enyl diphosphate reductase/30S ribosomal protein S1 [Oscillospiraceae bacterium]
MRVITAESAGFCFGVERAVRMCLEAAGKYPVTRTLGKLIHNREATDELAAAGALSAESVEDIPDGAAVVIRSHGVSPAEYAALDARNLTVTDATCPFVARIHELVAAADGAGRVPVIIGERDHAEVRASAGYAESTLVFGSPEEYAEWLNSGDNASKPQSVLFQTTLLRDIFDKTQEFAKKVCTNTQIFDTICAAALLRQTETIKLAAECDVMVVVGDRRSANTNRLYELASLYCRETHFVRNADELPALSGDITVGVTAGASVPARIIKEVNRKMLDEAEIQNEGTVAEEAENITGEVNSAAGEEPALAEAAEPAEKSEVLTEEPTFEEMLEKSIKTLRTGDKVIGIVAAITPTEVTVDLGIKQSGYILISELTDDPSKSPEDVAKIGEEIETFVIRVNDVDGIVQLSRRRIDAIKNWADVETAMNDKTVVEGKVTEENKGGVVVMVRGIRVFVPASRTGIPKGSPLTGLVGTTQKLLITEVNQPRRRVVGSISSAFGEERKLKAAKFWEEIEVGKRYRGTVRSLTSYGVFVDVGGVDGMVHVSELSWTRVNQPSDVVKVGEELDVYVISYDPEKKKISLGVKDRSLDPWKPFADKYGIGDVVSVRIVKIMPFGAFAEILPGVDGLIHVGQIVAGRRINSPGELLKEGETVDVKIIDLDTEHKKVSLSIRALTEQPENDNAAGTPDEVVYDTDHPEAYAGDTDDAPVSEAAPETETAEAAAEAVSDETPEAE